MPSVNAVSEILEQKFHKEFKAHHILSPTPGELSDYPETLHPKLQAVLRQQGVAQLYAYQAEAFGPISQGKDCLLVSRTASGKSPLCHCRF